MMTVGLDAAVVENDLRAGRPLCPWAGCGASLGPWCWARERRVRGAGRLQPRRGRCRGCGRTQVLLPASVLLRRAGGVGVIGLALLATPLGAGHRPIAETLKVPASTVRGWLRRIVSVAERVLAVLAAAAAQLGAEFTPPAPTANRVEAVVELLGALAASMARRLGGSCPTWHVAAVLTGSRLLAPAGPGVVLGSPVARHTNSLWASAP